MAVTFKIVSIVALSLGIVFLIASAIIFVKKQIWVVMADLSGKTAKASIEQLRSQSGKPAPRKRHSSYVQNSSYLKREKGTDSLKANKTDRIGKRGGKKTDILRYTNKTSPLQQETVPLQPGTAPLQPGTVPLQQGTVPLQPGTAPLRRGTVPLQPGTAVLSQGTDVLAEGTSVIGEAHKNPADFRIITDIVLIHTAEKLPAEFRG